MKLPIFQDEFSPFYLKHIAYSLKLSIFLPEDYIIYKDDLGSEMYFILEGIVNIMSSNEIKIIVSLGNGNYFGEIALFIPNTRRICSVKAETFCQLFILRKEDMERICKLFPILAEKFKKEGERRLLDYKHKQESIQAKVEDNENVPLLSTDSKAKRRYSFDEKRNKVSVAHLDFIKEFRFSKNPGSFSAKRDTVNSKPKMSAPSFLDSKRHIHEFVDEGEMDLENMKNKQSRRIKCTANIGRRFSRKTLGEDLILSTYSGLSLQWGLSNLNPIK